MTPAELWAHASRLPEACEEDRRTKISRCYYALYSHACAFSDSLESEGITFKKESGTHSRLSQKLTNPTVNDQNLQSNSRNMGTMQRLAHELRVKADYNLTDAVTKEDLKKCMGYVTRAMAIPVPVQKAA